MTKLDRYLQKARFNKAIPHIIKGGSLLDIGCHKGELLTHLQSDISRGKGIDPLTNPQAIAPHIQLVKGSFPEALTAGEQFTNITALALLEHVPTHYQQKFMDDCFSVLEAGGKFILTVPDQLVDMLLSILQKLRLVDGMSLEQHHGFDAGLTMPLATQAGFKLLVHQRFQAGFNNLFVFEKP